MHPDHVRRNRCRVSPHPNETDLMSSMSYCTQMWWLCMLTNLRDIIGTDASKPVAEQQLGEYKMAFSAWYVCFKLFWKGGWRYSCTLQRYGMKPHLPAFIPSTNKYSTLRRPRLILKNHPSAIQRCTIRHPCLHSAAAFAVLYLTSRDCKRVQKGI